MLSSPRVEQQFLVVAAPLFQPFVFLTYYFLSGVVICMYKTTHQYFFHSVKFNSFLLNTAFNKTPVIQ